MVEEMKRKTQNTELISRLFIYLLILCLKLASFHGWFLTYLIYLI